MVDRITGPLFKWFGSKWMASAYYPAPSTDQIIEPFAGGAGYSLRHFGKKVFIAESNKDVRALWLWLIRHATEDQIRAIPIDLPVGTNIKSIGLSAGQALLLKMWQRTNNVGSCWTTSPWGHMPGQWTASSRARVASEFHLIKHWRVGACGVDLLKKGLNTGSNCTWFIDPPYQYNYQYKSPLPIEYPPLGELITSLRGEIIACEAICPKTGATPSYLPFTFFRKMVTSRRKQSQSHHSKELMYYRPPINDSLGPVK